MVGDNVPASRHHGAPKHGDALLAGLLRCRRCGRKLTVRYTGQKHNIPRYSRTRGWLDNGEPRCIAFGGLRVTPKTLRRAAENGEIDAVHPLADGPWIFSRPGLEGEAAKALVERARSQPGHPTGPHTDQQNLFPSMA